MGTCCAGDPSQDPYTRMDMDRRNSDEGPTSTDSPHAMATNNDGKTAKQSIPSDAYLKPNINGNEAEESLQLPTGSILDTVNDHEPVPPSDYEDNDEQYAIAPHDNDAHEPGSEQQTEPQSESEPTPEPEPDAQTATETAQETAPQTATETVPEIAPESEPNDKAVSNGYSMDDNKEKEAEPVPAAYSDIAKEAPKEKHEQVKILENDGLRQRSVILVTADNNEFIKFLKKILKSKLSDKIWNKCDPHKNGRIESEKFMYFWTLPVTLFKVAIFQRKNGNKQKPKLDQKELKKDFMHLATWIIRRYGEKQSDGGATFVLTQENFAKNIVDYVTSYADAKGELYEQY